MPFGRARVVELLSAGSACAMNSIQVSIGVVEPHSLANMPGAVPRTSTFALTNATGPYVRQLADRGPKQAAHDPVLGTAANILAGQLTHEGVGKAFDLPWVLADKAL